MMPEESVQAAKDLQAWAMIPIHWGAFSLVLHAWTEPVERVLVKAKQIGILVFTPWIGEQIIIDATEIHISYWWMK